MRKFKKGFFTVLVCILVLSMVLPTVPAFALGSENMLTTTPSPVKTALAEIKSMLVLESYPPQIKLTGTLPSPCYQLNVSTQVVAGTGKVLVWVRGVAPRSVFCAQGVRFFTTTVVLDPAKLNLTPNKYMAMINPVNGQSAFKVSFTVPTPQMEAGLASISKMTALGSYPFQFKISGMMSSACYTLHVSAPQVTGRVISVFLRQTKPLAVTCVQTLKSFSTIVTIDPAKLKLAPGRYTVLFNPAGSVSPFTSYVFGGVD